MEYIVTRTENRDELYHYGVKGMKWGRRKKTNKDKSVTGKKINKKKLIKNSLLTLAGVSLSYAGVKFIQNDKIRNIFNKAMEKSRNIKVSDIKSDIDDWGPVIVGKDGNSVSISKLKEMGIL